MKYYIGIDGGGTKTTFLVGRVSDDFSLSARGGADADSDPETVSSSAAASASEVPAGIEIIGEYTGGGCHYMQIGFDGLETLIRDGLTAACENAGIRKEDVAFAFIGFAGFGDVVSDQPMINRALKSAFGDMPYAAENDTANALEGALGGKPGINIIAGTGAIGRGCNVAGDSMRCGGWHYILGGDEGSAYWIAWNLLKEYSRQSDGRDEKTLLYDAVNEALDLHTDDEMVTRVVNEWKLDRPRIAGLAPVVSRLYAEGDPYAFSILNGCAKELADLAIVLHRKLGFDNAAYDGTDVAAVTDTDAASCSAVIDDMLVPVSGTGGVFKIGAPVTDPFDQILRQHGMKYVKAKYTPDVGALLLAIKHGA